MLRKRAGVLIAALGLAVGLTTPPAAQAQNFWDTLRGYPYDGYPNVGRHHGGKILGNSWEVQRNVDNGIANYHRELYQGVASGRLTRGEVAVLQSELDNIIAMRNQFMADGGYSAPESQAMVNAFNRLNSLIAAELNNSNTGNRRFAGRRWSRWY